MCPCLTPHCHEVGPPEYLKDKNVINLHKMEIPDNAESCIATIDVSNRITVDVQLRKALDLNPGDRVKIWIMKKENSD